MSFVSSSDSAAIPSDCSKMINSIQENTNPLIISIDVENNFIYVGFKSVTKKVAAAEYSDCFRNIDGLIKDQIYYIGNIKINYYDSKSVSKGITGNAVAATSVAPTRTPSTTRSATTARSPRSAATTTTRSAATTTTRSAATTTTRSAATTRATPNSNSATPSTTRSATTKAPAAKAESSEKTAVNVNSLVAFRGYKYFADDSGKRSNIYATSKGIVYLQRPSFGGIFTDYFFPDKKLGNVTSEPAGNFIDLDASVEKAIGTETFNKLSGKIIDDSEKIAAPSAEKELKVAGEDGKEVATGMTIDERGYIRPSANKSEKIGTIDKTGKISMYDPKNYSASTRKALGTTAAQIHNTQATNGTIRSLAKVDNKGYADPTAKRTAPVIATRTTPAATNRTTTRTTTPTNRNNATVTTRTNSSRIVANPGTGSPGTPIVGLGNRSTSPAVPTPGKNPVTTNPGTGTTPSLSACQRSCQSSTGYTPPTAGMVTPTVVTSSQSEYNNCVKVCAAGGGTPGTPGYGNPGGIGGGKNPGGSSPGTGDTGNGAGGNAASQGGNCAAGNADVGPCSCDISLGSFTGDCTNTPGVAGAKPQYKTFSCKSSGGSTKSLSYSWVPNVVNCDGQDKNGCKKEGSKCTLTDNALKCDIEKNSGKNDGKQKCEQDKTTLVCDWGKCVKEDTNKKPAKAPATKNKKKKSK